MKNKILFIALAVVLALSMGLIGCGDGDGLPDIPDQPTTLVIGTARDTDEHLAIFEQVAAGPIMREFVEQVNAAGGVHLKEYDTANNPPVMVPLEIDRREINALAWDIGDITAEICADIADGDVHFMWGGPGTDSIFAQAPIANGAKVVLLTFEGGATVIANDPEKLAKWPYVFLTLPYSDWHQLPVLYEMLETELGRTPKAYVVHIWGEHGEEYLASTIAAGFDVVDDVEIPFDPAEYDAGEVVQGAIAALTATPYDIFCCFAYPDHVMATTGTAIALEFNPPAMIFGPGANFGFYAASFGPPEDPAVCAAAVEGVMSFTCSAYTATPEIQAVYDLLAERIDDDANDPISGLPGLPGILQLDYWGFIPYWSGLEMWLAAVEEVGYVDQDLLREALADFEDNPMSTVMADECWFRMYGTPGQGGGNQDYLCHTGSIGQWQSGVFETIGYEGITADMPNYITTGTIKFPMTDQWGWLP